MSKEKHSHTHFMQHHPIEKTLHIALWPVIITYLFQALYLFNDFFWSTTLGAKSEIAFGAAFSFNLIIIGVGVSLNGAAKTLLSQYIGAKNPQKAIYYYQQALLLTIILYVLVSFTLDAFIPTLLPLFHFTPEISQITSSYLHHYLFLSTPIRILAYLSVALAIATGRQKILQFTQIGITVLDIFMDPLFIYGFHLQLNGIAFSLAINYSILFLVVNLSILTSYFHFLKWKQWLPKIKMFWHIFILAFPSFINRSSMAVGFFIYSFFISQINPYYVAAFGLGSRYENIFIFILTGLAISMSNLITNNWSGEKFDRLFPLFNKTFRFISFFIFPCLLIFVGFSYWMVQALSDGSDIIRWGALSYILIVMLFNFYNNAILLTSGLVLQGIKKPAFNIVIAVLRQIILAFSFSVLALWVFHTGIIGLWISFVLKDTIVAMIALTYTRKQLKKIVTHKTPIQ